MGIALLAACVGIALLIAAPSHRAEAAPSLAEAQSALDEAEANMQALSEEYDALKAEVEALQTRIDATVAQAMEAQQRIIEGRSRLGELANYEYRGGSVGVLDLLLNAESFSDLIRNLEYLSSIQDYHAGIIAEHKDHVAFYNALLEKLNQQRDEQDVKLAQLEEKRAEAERIVEEASANLADAQAEADRLEALARTASSMGGSYTDPGIYDGWNTNPGANDEAAGGGEEPGATGWFTGVASAYGGSSDPYTPNPGITATGAVCDDYSMGVAVPMSWSNYRQYFGRSVEISYNGMTVIAVVNDCGYMGGGSRSLDLQPGVFKAFGFPDCYAWGLRTVSFRFL